MPKMIKCPKCQTEFEIDENYYLDIVQQVKNEEFEKELASRLKEVKATNELAIKNREQELVNKYNQELTELRNEKEAEIIRLNGDLKNKDIELEQARDYKARLSTKGVGEDLEKYCANEFEKVRSMGFPNAEFGKDNDSSSGTKGDFIFRDFDASGDSKVEFVSIMFEMKNEVETTENKHKNEDFFKKLDKDRNEKGCEYAVLVSMLEADNEYYNTGIVDVSHIYPKMYVIRPQFFLPMITLIRNAAQKTISYKNELAKYENEHIDIKALSDYILETKADFGEKVKKSHDKFNSAIDDIDKTIKKLQDIRDELTKSGEYLTKANNLLVDLELTKVAKKNPTLKSMMIEQGIATEDDFKRKKSKKEGES